ncbi:class I SAM-dependent DNA methyltransferase [Spirillospora sp. NPDC048911]|uniref:class I SAM-dependent DNA methyltransferase n=1 Tax=Spirillospora sp. NPDC048911 TaxID=3364527 RepID=UPI0037124B42
MTEPIFVSTTRMFYDAIAADYAEHFKGKIAHSPLDVAVLNAFAEMVGDTAGPVADLGCGPGRVTAHLRALGLDVFGVDLSAEMLGVARRENPGLRFVQGSMAELDAADGSLAGAVSWYSIIHTPAERLPGLFTEFHRVLAPGGHLLVAFQVGEEPMHLAEPFGRQVSLDFNRLLPDQITDLLRQAGFGMVARTRREPITEVETTPQAFLLARKPEA